MGRKARAWLGARQRLGHFCNLEPAKLRGFDFGAVAGDAFSELSETLRIARVEVGVMERGFVCGDLGLQPLDLTRQPVVIPLVLVR